MAEIYAAMNHAKKRKIAGKKTIPHNGFKELKEAGWLKPNPTWM